MKKSKMTLEDIAGCVRTLSFDELKRIEVEIEKLS